MQKRRFYLLFVVFLNCFSPENPENVAWQKHGRLVVQNSARYIQHADGTPFLWLGCTAWGMTEWLTREDVELYLTDRRSKGMNVVQLCLFWGKRLDYPTVFTANAENPYGHRALQTVNDAPDPAKPAVVAGGSADNPNDYWDHVDYCLDAIKKRGMYAAVLPFWGRRYVNASHSGQSKPVFTPDNIRQYGEFLGKRYGSQPHIIWVNGGDVRADEGGDFRPHYRLLAEGLVRGMTGNNVKWDQQHPAWQRLLLTYHPSGHPMVNSSQWFHTDPWLDFNMIETHVSRHKLPSAIRQDYTLQPVKPTVMAEGHYEGTTGNKTASAIHVRRQAYQTFFAGAAGFTYGGGFDAEGNGPLFSPSNNWKPLLSWQGAGQLVHLRAFLEKYKWWTWQPDADLIVNGRGEGELEKLAVETDQQYLIYFPDNSGCTVRPAGRRKVLWYRPATGRSLKGDMPDDGSLFPPAGWQDGILVLSVK